MSLGLSCLLLGGCSTPKSTNGRCTPRVDYLCGPEANCPNKTEGRRVDYTADCQIKTSGCSPDHCNEGLTGGVMLPADGL